MVPKKEEDLSKEKLLAEIDRLKKELKKRKKYGLVWEEKPEDLVEMCEKSLPVLKEVKREGIITDGNKRVKLWIEGDNYHALSVLNLSSAPSFLDRQKKLYFGIGKTEIDFLKVWCHGRKRDERREFC